MGSGSGNYVVGNKMELSVMTPQSISIGGGATPAAIPINANDPGSSLIKSGEDATHVTIRALALVPNGT